jgi:DNA-binding Lrp family transcriptional regulator
MEQNKRKQLLKLIESDCRLSIEEYAVMLGEDEVIVSAEIKRMEQEKIICGYREIAERVRKFPEVKSFFFVSGGFDFILLLQGRNIKEISKFISTNLASIPDVSGTQTHFLLDKYKEWGVDMYQDDSDPRIQVSP